MGFVGILFALLGVEAFNEYFDSRLGTDRVFELEQRPVPGYVFALGLAAFALAFALGCYLAMSRGVMIILFALLGFIIAAFYVGPPLRLAYRGLGELSIFLAYGPLMTLGSYYLQVGRLDDFPLALSLVPGLLVFCVCLANEIPDYFQDRLVGKRNIVVRLGRQKALRLYRAALLGYFLVVAIGVASGFYPRLFLSVFLLVPWVYRGARVARRYYDQPPKFIPAIRMSVALYVVSVCVLVVGLVKLTSAVQP